MNSHIELTFSKFADEAKRRAEITVTECLIEVGKYSALLTPMATSFLLNSQYRIVEITADGVHGEIGYGANYAEYVHDAPGKLLGTNTPRHPRSDGVVWGPNAEPEFLMKGVESMVQTDLGRLIKENLQV